MISIRRIRIGEGELFKQMRLASLKEAPYAFSSTYESAVRRSTTSWSDQADRTAKGSDRATFFVFSDDSPIGIAALYRHPEGSDEGELLQVWVAPECRGKGLALALLDAVLEWAARSGFRNIKATIAKGNRGAIRFYQRCGFDGSDGNPVQGSEEVVLSRKID